MSAITPQADRDAHNTLFVHGHFTLEKALYRILREYLARNEPVTIWGDNPPPARPPEHPDWTMIDFARQALDRLPARMANYDAEQWPITRTGWLNLARGIAHAFALEHPPQTEGEEG